MNIFVWASLFKCTHPAARLAVDQREVKTKLDGYDTTTYHLLCQKCGAPVRLRYVETHWARGLVLGGTTVGSGGTT